MRNQTRGRDDRFLPVPLTAAASRGRSGLIRDPVHFPRLAAVGGKGLFGVCRVRGDVGPIVANEDPAAVPFLLVVELSFAVLEFADRGDTDRAPRGGGPVEAPLVRDGIVDPEGEAFDRTDLELIEVGAATP